MMEQKVETIKEAAEKRPLAAIGAAIQSDSKLALHGRFEIAVGGLNDVCAT